jgi:O-antigen/teichoic acid export membrane protein
MTLPAIRLPRRVGSNARSLVLGNAVYAAGQWVQLVVLARMGGAAAVGEYAFALALTAPVMNFAGLHLRALQATDAKGAYAFREYRRLRVVTTVAAMIAIALIAGGAGYGPEVWRILVPVSAMRAADALADVYQGVWQRHERMSVSAWALTLNSVCSVTFMGVAALLGGGVPGAAVGAALGSVVALVFTHAVTVTDRQLQALVDEHAPASWRRLSRLAAQAAPLGVVLLLGSLQQNVPRYFIRNHGGEVALGLFAAASQLTAAGGMVVAALGGASSPRLASLWTAGDTGSFRSLTRRLVAAGALLGVAGVALAALIGRDVLILVYRPEFGSGAPVLVVLSGAAGMGFVAMFYGYALTSARFIGIQPVVLSVTLLVLVTSCAALVPRHGGIGAAWALAAAHGIQALASGVALRRLGARSGGAHAAALGS